MVQVVIASEVEKAKELVEQSLIATIDPLVSINQGLKKGQDEIDADGYMPDAAAAMRRVRELLKKNE
jgi:methanogenic corrinoid protein MtbC1